MAVLHRDSFEDLHDFQKKRICHFGNDKAKNPAASGHQSARPRIRIVAEFFNYGPYASSQLSVDGRGPG